MIQKVETGQGGSRLETLIRIALALGVSLDILANVGEMNEQERMGQEMTSVFIAA